jgi:hypothetical protein
MKPLSRSIRTSSLVLSLVAVLLVFGSFGFANGGPSFKLSVDPGLFDPHQTKLVAAQWIGGIGCPTGATEVLYNVPTFVPYLLPPSAFTDAACPTGDPKDRENEGLLFVKTGDTYNDASATATVKGVKGIVLSEIGYDIRTGSHCGGGAPRFNITTTNGKSYFLSCTNLGLTTPFSSLGWRRLRWGTGTPGSVQAYRDGNTPEFITDPIQTISMIFDEAQDANAGSDFSGLAVLDNIDINGQLVGRDSDNDDHGRDTDHGKDNDHGRDNDDHR